MEQIGRGQMKRSWFEWVEELLCSERLYIYSKHKATTLLMPLNFSTETSLMHCLPIFV